MDPKFISIQDFSYNLPEHKIAVFPLEKRDESKLLLYKNHQITDTLFQNLPLNLPEETLLIANNTRVIHARIYFQKLSGSQIEVFCLEPKNLNYEEAFLSKKECTWKVLLGNAKRWKGEILEKEILVHTQLIKLQAELIKKDGAFGVVKFTWVQTEINFGELLHFAGILPLPPYLNRVAGEKDEISYQTLFAKKEGSVAAPTAGLHFTEQVIESLKKKKILQEEITLHVGAGTFMPVKSDTMADHEMHRETVIIAKSTLVQIEKNLIKQKAIVPVGTTSLRTLESLYWFGLKLMQGGLNQKELLVNQWDPYELTESTEPIGSIQAILKMMELNGLDELIGSTQLLIAPGYKFKFADGLITNFHQPNSTLLLLVAAFLGENWKRVYEYALENNFRFLSFGDSSLLWRN
ncbi:MAG: S-adenosylmethionine:tRNA ribosyltransferase-isomerase [Bacteroidia bacterium]|nr:S-adenosylmethionine:tRNA ribosyltransferase-isomerase [Bacteroidia bacterium]MCF8428141.1 S-adenosylmethionine:tRNA ribosyltransferase-isomerase [Bacteroidia bacterium]MCF8447905.1 S-adenosylmethionine:tRNA ribosyltransferase-isomerase [Bacteroidia bacterium]